MQLIASWSGGKDCCLACYKAVLAGHQIVSLLNLVSKEHDRCCFHGIDKELIRLQSDLIGIPVLQKPMSDDMKQYESEFKSAVREIQKSHKVDGIIFGDIYLDEHKAWTEQICRELDMIAFQPLWNMAPEDVFTDFINAGFNAIIISCKADIMQKRFAGMSISINLLQELKENNICPCGENGEFHTLVTNGPMFHEPIVITRAEPVLKHGFWTHWSLDISEWENAPNKHLNTAKKG